MFSFVEVSGCMSPQLHPSFVLSLFSSRITHPHMHTSLFPSHTEGCIMKYCRDACWVDAGLPEGFVAICFKIKKRAGGEGVGGGTEEKWSPSCKGWRLGRLKEIFMSVIWRGMKQLIGTRQLRLCRKRQLIHLLLLLFCVLCSGFG